MSDEICFFLSWVCVCVRVRARARKCVVPLLLVQCYSFQIPAQAT